MQTFFAFSKPCHLHEDRRIAFICLAQSCRDRLLCLQCQKDHSREHEDHIKTLNELLEMDIEGDIQSARKNFHEKEAKLEQDRKTIMEFFEQLKKRIIQDIEEVKEDMLKKLVKMDYCLSKFEQYKSSFNKARENLKLQNHDEYVKNREDFVKICSNFYLFKQELNEFNYESKPFLNSLIKINFEEYLDFRQWLFAQLEIENIEKPIEAQHRWSGIHSDNLVISNNGSRLEVLSPITGGKVKGGIGTIFKQGEMYKITCVIQAFDEAKASFGVGIYSSGVTQNVEECNLGNSVYYIVGSGSSKGIILNKKTTDLIGKRIGLKINLKDYLLEFTIDGLPYARSKLDKNTDYALLGIFGNVKSGYIEIVE